MASATVPTGGARRAKPDHTLAHYEHLLARVEVLVDHRRLGPMSFEDPVGLTHELVREGIPLWQRLVPGVY